MLPLRSTRRPHSAMKLSVVIPCYNEQEVLPELFRRLTGTAERWGCEWEVLCVNDGSRDRT